MRGGAATALLVVVGVALLQAARVSGISKKKAEELRSNCDECRSVASKFYEGVETTAKNIEFSGGNKEGWTLEKEKFLGKYQMNEARLIEIIEGLCGRNHKCAVLLEEEFETRIEEWWPRRAELGDLEAHLCVAETGFCCPKGHFGKSCRPCSGGAETPCSGHGDCVGDGYRTGTGKCKCNAGFADKDCSACAPNYFKGEDGECQACDEACLGCTGPLEQDCSACNTGFEAVDEPTGGCRDVDECADPAQAGCTDTQYCANTRGSFSCRACNAGCKDGCAGPDLKDCASCADGYSALETGGCEDVDECAGAAMDECATGEYCSNTPGSYSCQKCDTTCSAEGCTAAGSASCKSCAEGHEKLDTGSCVDVDECKRFPCALAGVCENQIGSFSCSCPGPSQAEGEECSFPDAVTAMLEAPLLEADAATDPETGFVKGKATVGPSAVPYKRIQVQFAEALPAVPQIQSVQPNNECCGDQFSYAASEVTAAGFALLVRRIDTQQGWGQELSVDWRVVYGDSPAPRDEADL